MNPDCGLKTRGWKETEPALRAMVEAPNRSGPSCRIRRAKRRTV
ncbi:MAG: hypothetical protein WDN72_09335 [Alphaproteobacteria bacterium]